MIVSRKLEIANIKSLQMIVYHCTPSKNSSLSKVHILTLHIDTVLKKSEKQNKVTLKGSMTQSLISQKLIKTKRPPVGGGLIKLRCEVTEAFSPDKILQQNTRLVRRITVAAHGAGKITRSIKVQTKFGRGKSGKELSKGWEL
jgi:hypothetical protein